MDVEKLASLADLRDKGILSQEEFDEQKLRLLGKSSEKDADVSSKVGKLSMWSYFIHCIFKKFGVPKGRTSRKEFWAFFLFSFLSIFGLTFLLILGGFSVSIVELLLKLWIIPMLTLVVRRAHDLNISAAVVFAWFVVCTLAFFYSEINPSFNLVGLVIYWGMIITIGSLKGNPVANRFGDVPTGLS